MPRGRPLETDLPPTVSPTDVDIAWAAGVFQCVGKINFIPMQGAVPSLDLLLRVQFFELRGSILDKFLSFFGGRVRLIFSRGNGGERRLEWCVQELLARNALQLFLPHFDPAFTGKALTALNAINVPLSSFTRPGETAFGAGQTAARAVVPVIPPKTDIVVPPDFDENIFAYADALDAGSSVVYGFPDEQTLSSFLDEASIRSYDVERVELTLTISKRIPDVD
jgi:hypothetical protein